MRFVDPAARAAIALAVIATATAAARLPAQEPQRYGFATIRGTDTIAVESVLRLPTRLTVDLLVRSAGVRESFTAELAAPHRVRSMSIEARQANASSDAPPLQKAELTFADDSVTVRAEGGAGGGTQRFGVAAGTQPFVNLDWALIEDAIAHARTAPDHSTPLFAVAGGRTTTLTTAPLAGDSLRVTLAGIEMHAAIDAAGRLTGGTVPVQGLTIVRTGPMNAPQAPPRDYSAPAGAPYVADTVRVPAGDHTLGGTLTLPRSHAGPVAAVVTISGSGLEDRDERLPGVQGYAPFREIADTLGRRGVAVLRLDDRGFGASTGDAQPATSADFADDVRAAVAWLRAREDVDGERIVLLGHSEGGLIAPMVAATDPELAGIVLMAGPALNGRAILEYQLRQGIEASAPLPPAKRDSLLGSVDPTIDSLAAASPWVRYFLTYDPLPTARRVRVPALVLQGGTDWQIRPDQAPQLAAALRAGGDADVTLKVFPELDHLFLPDVSGNPAGYAALPDHSLPAAVLGTIADWIVTHTSPGS